MKIVWGSARACPVASPKAPRVRNPSGTFRRRLKVTLLSCGKTACPCQRTSWKRCCWQYEQIATGLRTASGGCAGEVGLPSAPPARQPYHYEAGQSICADRCPRASRTGPGHLAGHSAANGHRGGGLHSIALSGRAGACALLAMLAPPPLLPNSPPCQPCLTLSGTDP